MPGLFAAGVVILTSFAGPASVGTDRECGPRATPPQPLVSASFTVVSAAGSREYRLEGDATLVFCRRTSEEMVWIRLASSAVNDGSDAAHLDLDVCNLPAAGPIGPMVARAQPCPGGATWAIWWHDEDGGVFANDLESTGCDLTVERIDDRLIGDFSCRGIVSEDGETRVDIVDGRFECVLEEDAPAEAAWWSRVEAANVRPVTG